MDKENFQEKMPEGINIYLKTLAGKTETKIIAGKTTVADMNSTIVALEIAKNKLIDQINKNSNTVSSNPKKG